MCSNFIKEQDRPTPNLFGHKVCMRQNDTKEKRLLLSRRTAGRWLPFAKMLDCKVAPMGAGKRAASRGIARSSLRKFIDKFSLILPTRESQSRPRERAISRRCHSLVQQCQKIISRSRNCRAVLRHLAFQSAKPIRICWRFSAEQPIALAHCRVIAGRMLCMHRFKG